jgi:hypothetical protein
MPLNCGTAGTPTISANVGATYTLTLSNGLEDFTWHVIAYPDGEATYVETTPGDTREIEITPGGASFVVARARDACGKIVTWHKSIVSPCVDPGGWTELGVTMPVAIYMFAIAINGSDVWVHGGYDSSSTVLRTTRKFDASTDSWTALVDETGQYREEHSGAIYNNKFYIAFGWDNVPNPKSSLYYFDGATWTYHSPNASVSAAEEAQIQVIGDRVYYHGGWTYKSYLLTSYDNPSLGSGPGVSCYNAPTAVWGGDFFIFSGYNDKIYQWDVSGSTWYTFHTGFPSNFDTMCRSAVIIGNNVYIVLDKDSAYESWLYKFAMDTKTWTPLVEMPRANLKDMGMVAYGNYVYIFGGQYWSGSAWTASDKIYKYDTSA